jgi:hypothetical protein
MMPEGVPRTESRDDGSAGTPASGETGGSPGDPPPCSVWAMGVAADAVGPLEWWPPKRLRPYAPRHVTLPTFRDTPNWAILRDLVKESGVREPLLVLPDGQVVDGAHRLELAKALGLPEVPVRVLNVPKPLRDEDRTQIETVRAVLAVARRHIAPSRVPGLLLGLTQAQLAAGVLNRGVANLRRGRAPAPGLRGPTQRALAESAGLSDRTVRRLVRVGREGSDDLRRAVASGDLSVKQADRRLAAAKTDRPPGGPLILRALPKAAIGRDDPQDSGNGSGRNGARRPPAIAMPAPLPEASLSGPDAPTAPTSPPLPTSVQAFLALCHELDAATERFRRETARWTGERRANRRLTIRQTVQHLSEQLDWMQATEATHHEPRPV